MLWDYRRGYAPRSGLAAGQKAACLSHCHEIGPKAGTALPLSSRAFSPLPPAHAEGGGSGRSRGSCAARGPSAGLSQPAGVPLPLSSWGSWCFGHPRPHRILSVGRAPLRLSVIPRPSLLRPRGQGEAAVPSPSPNPEENPEPTPKNAATLPSLPLPKPSRSWHPQRPNAHTDAGHNAII